MGRQRTPPRAEVLPNTLSGEAQPNTLSTMPGKPASGWTTGGAQPPSRQRTSAGQQPGRPPNPLLRVFSWVLLLIIALAILSLLGR